jgi:gliding motility-associated lipoprotein GldH
MFKSGNKLSSFLCLQLFACSLQLLSSCTTIDLYEKVVPVPKHQWQSSYKPQFTFNIIDTTVPYQAFVILRHNNKYKYNNIWINLHANAPTDTTQKLSLELPLANKEGWLGTGMDDVFEHRVRIGGEIGKLPFVKMGADGFYFTRSGEYRFTLEQIMRDDPLPDVMNIGLRLEKKAP